MQAQIKKEFKHKTLEERTAEFGGKLGPYEEMAWGEEKGREQLPYELSLHDIPC